MTSAPTPDLGGTASTSELADAVLDRVAAASKEESWKSLA
jgi:hypothetical protein